MPASKLKLIRALLITCLFVIQPQMLPSVSASSEVSAEETVVNVSRSSFGHGSKVKARLEYRLEYEEEIPLRVTQIPTEFGMIHKDLEGKVLPLKLGDEVVLESIRDIKLSQAGLETVLLPSGSRFYAKVKNREAAKSFNRDGFIELEFYKIEVLSENISKREISLAKGALTADNSEQREGLSNRVQKVGKAMGYTLGGALLAPLITYQVVGTLAFSNPQITAAAAATGAAIGLAYGIATKGKNFNLEPGSELKVKLKNNWFLDEIPLNQVAETGVPQESPVTKVSLKVNKVKKVASAFNQKCLKVNLDYENRSSEELRYLSFRLVDSMKKEYFPEIGGSKNGHLGELPVSGNMDLLYCVDFPKAIYTLELRSLDDYELLANQKIISI